MRPNHFESMKENGTSAHSIEIEIPKNKYFFFLFIACTMRSADASAPGRDCGFARSESNGEEGLVLKNFEYDKMPKRRIPLTVFHHGYATLFR